MAVALRPPRHADAAQQQAQQEAQQASGLQRRSWKVDVTATDPNDATFEFRAAARVSELRERASSAVLQASAEDGDKDGEEAEEEAAQLQEAAEFDVLLQVS